MVEDEFSEEVSDQVSLHDTGQPEQRTRVLVLKPEEILADPLPEAEENNSASEKVIHINTRSDFSKPSILGISVASITPKKSPVKRSASITPIPMETVFLCPDVNCKLKLPSQATLLTHMKMCHSAEDVKIGDESMMSEELSDEDDNLHEHDQSVPVKKVRIQECSICNYKAKSSAELKRHLKAEHLEQKSFACPECNIVVSRKYHLIRHIKAVHENERFWQCETCDYKTNNFGCYKKHKHSKPNSGDCDLQYSVESMQKLPPGITEADLKCVCTWCAFKSQRYSTVKKHIEIYHERTKSYPCKECLFVAENVDDYAKHFNDYHKTDDYPHSCTDCNFKCTNKLDLKQHYISEHNKQKEYVCRTCRYRTLDYNNMKRHILTVHAPSPVLFKCDHCTSEFESKDDLNSHMYNDHGFYVADINSDDMKVVIINEDDQTIYTTA